MQSLPIAKTKIPILTYHSIDQTQSVITIRPEQFREHMQWLAAAGYSVVSLRDVLQWIRQGGTVNTPTVAVTFDDGFKNFFTSALPVLQELGFRATVFLVTGRCGLDNAWPGQLSSVPRLPMMDWSEVRQAAQYGIEFGAHTVTHPDLSGTLNDHLDREIRGSKDMIEDQLGSTVNGFAYPYGICTPEAQAIVKKNFEGACSTEMGMVSRHSDPFFLPRVDMYYFSTNRMFYRLGTRPFDLYVGVRKLIRRIRSGFPQ